MHEVRDNKALSSASAQAVKDGIPLLALFILSPQDYIAHDRSARRIDFTLRNLQVIKVSPRILLQDVQAPDASPPRTPLRSSTSRSIPSVTLREPPSHSVSSLCSLIGRLAICSLILNMRWTSSVEIFMFANLPINQSKLNVHLFTTNASSILE